MSASVSADRVPLFARLLVMAVGASVRRARAHGDGHVVDVGTQPEAHRDVPPRVAAEPHVDDPRDRHPRTLRDEEHHRELVIGDAALPHHDHLALRHVIVVGDRDVKVPDARRDAVGRLRVGSLGGDHAAKGQSQYDDAALNGHC